MFPCCQNKSSDAMLDDITNKPHEVFAVDLMFFFSKDPKAFCQPDCQGTYEIHPMSPLNEDIRRFIEMGCKKDDTFYNFMFQTYKAGCKAGSTVFENFSRDMARELQAIASADVAADTTINFVMSKLVHIVKLAIEFHKGGTEGVVSFVLKNMAEALAECNTRNNGQIFELLSMNASCAIALMPSQS